MSFRYLAWAQSAKTGSPTTKAILMALCSIVNDDGVGWPSQKRISDDCEYSLRTVKSAMKKLEQDGIITRTRRYRDGGYRTSDIIQINQEPILGATNSPEIAAPEILGATVSNLRCTSGLAEPVNEPVSIIKKEKAMSDFPENFTLDMATQKVADKFDLTDNDVLNEIDAMKDWAVNAGTKGRKKDWQAFARNWFRKNGKQRKSNGNHQANSIKGGFDAIDAAIRSEQARLRGSDPRDGDGEAHSQNLPRLLKISP